MGHQLGSGSSLENEFQAAQDAATPADVLVNLSTINNSALQQFVIANPNTPESVLLNFLHHSKSLALRETVLRRGNLSKKVLEELLQTKDEETLVIVLMNPHMPVEKLISYAEHANHLVRRSIAGNPSTPTHVVENLIKMDESMAVLGAAARNPNATQTVLDIALASHYLVRQWLTCNPNLPEEYAARLVKDKSESVRESLASKETCPSHLLERLAHDKHLGVAKQAIVNKTMPAEILERLAIETNIQVKDWIPRNKNVNEKTLEYLARNGNTRVKTEVSRSPQTPAWVLLLLVGEDDWVINDAVTARLQEIDDAEFEKALIKTGYQDFATLPREWVIKAITSNNRTSAAYQ